MKTKYFSRIPFILDPGKKIMKSSKKIQKILKPLPTKFYFRIPFILDPGKKIPRKIEKKFKKL